MLMEYNQYLSNPQGTNNPMASATCRRRVVILIEMGDGQTPPVAAEPWLGCDHGSVPTGEDDPRNHSSLRGTRSSSVGQTPSVATEPLLACGPGSVPTAENDPRNRSSL